MEGFYHDFESGNTYDPDGGNRNDVWFSGDGETWEEVTNTPWAPRHGSGAST